MTNAPSSLPTGFAYEDSDVPADMRLDQWHAARNRERRAAEIRARRERRNAFVANLRRRARS